MYIFQKGYSFHWVLQVQAKLFNLWKLQETWITINTYFIPFPIIFEMKQQVRNPSITQPFFILLLQQGSYDFEILCF